MKPWNKKKWEAKPEQTPAEKPKSAWEQWVETNIKSENQAKVKSATRLRYNKMGAEQKAVFEALECSNGQY